MISSIKKEIVLRNFEFENKSLKSLYFGGGTPSILKSTELASIFKEIQNYFKFENDIEITLEANPDDLNAKFIKEIISLGINRLSIGTQSFFEKDLKLMNRAHTAGEAEDSIKRSQDLGIENISIDLIYGSPGSSFGVWKSNLQKAVELQIPHISSYALTIEPNTALNTWVKNKKVPPPSEKIQNEEFYFMSEFLKQNGFEHYEISNFGKPGLHSRHNSAYWDAQPYLGIGPSAHSYDGKNIRKWNVANNLHYIRSLAENKLPTESEELTEKDRFNEMIMIGLRTTKGVELNKIKTDFDSAFFSHLYKEVQPKIDSQLLIIDGERLKIPEEHWFLADGIASDLFVI